MTKEEILQPLKDHSREENEVLLEYDNVLKAMDIYAEERCKKLVEALNGIKNCSDCGSETAKIIVMQRIAKEALTTYNNSLNKTK